MANDRMWLVHKPTGRRTLIAKHFGDRWIEYTGPRHRPYYGVDELFIATNDNSTEYEIRFESTE